MKKNLKKMITMILALMMLLATSITVFATDETASETNAVVMTENETEAENANADNTKGDKAYAAAIAVGISAAAGAIAMGWAIAKSAEGISRQPEAEGKIRTMMILGIGLSETVAIYGLLISFLLLFIFPGMYL